jgi:arylsulfatase A-like enzyme
LTGKHSFKIGVYNVPVLEQGSPDDNIFSRWTVGLEHDLYANPLRDAGYKLIHLGKWHIVGPYPEAETNYPFSQPLVQPASGDMSWVEHHKSAEIQKYYPVGRGFNENIGGTWWGDPARGHVEGYQTSGGGYVAPFNNPFTEDEEEGEWLTDRLTTEAIKFIGRNQDQPFFVNLHFYAPHRPTAQRNTEWFQYFMNKPGDEISGQGIEHREEMAAYATMVKSIDENVHRIVDCLEERGLRRKTIVIFTSDNGFNGLQSCNRNLRGTKGTVYEGGLRVPAFINWPGHVAPGRTDALIAGVDYFPTFLDLARMQDYDRSQLDGISLCPVMCGKPSGDRTLFWHLASTYKNPPCSIIRTGDWKLIQWLKDGSVELYNITEDLGEKCDVSGENPEVVMALTKQLSGWRRKNNVPLPPSSSLEF